MNDVNTIEPPANKTAALVLAAGRGRRLGGEIPKQYLTLAGKSVLRRSIERFLDVAAIDVIRAVIHPDDLGLYEEAVFGVEDVRLISPVFGGATRAETTVKGLESLSNFSPDRVLIHDGARPFVTPEIIVRVLTALEEAEGAFAGVPVVDALWRMEADGNAAQSSVPRDHIWRAQTPQGFDFQAILTAHRAQGADLADDVAIARAAGMRVVAVDGDESNFKITLAQDVQRAEALLAQRNT